MTVVTVCASYMVTLLWVRGSRMQRFLIELCILIPFWISVLTRAFGWLALLSNKGILNTWAQNLGFLTEPLTLVRNEFGVVVGMVHFLIPFAAFPLAYSILMPALYVPIIAMLVGLVLRGVATVEDVDTAVRCGPGLRWAAMGPHLLYDLGGGEGGIRGHMEHLAASKEGMLRDLATWTMFPAETAETLDAGLAREKAGRSHAELAAERDSLLVSFMRARRSLRR